MGCRPKPSPNTNKTPRMKEDEEITPAGCYKPGGKRNSRRPPFLKSGGTIKQKKGLLISIWKRHNKSLPRERVKDQRTGDQDPHLKAKKEKGAPTREIVVVPATTPQKSD